MSIKAWHLIWLAWFGVSFGTFLLLEIYGLCTNWHRTLSAAIWDMERFREGEPISHWSAGHLWFVGILALLFVWLLMHFAVGWWRS